MPSVTKEKWFLQVAGSTNLDLEQQHPFEEVKRSALSLRADTFSTSWPLDEEILEIATAFPSHSFLANPSGQYAYIYLTRFVQAFSEKHFHHPFTDLTILDWGCGKGHVSKLIRALGPKRLDSCDIQSGASDSTFGQDVPIIQRYNISVTPLKHEYLLPYEPESFDIVLSFGVLEHVANERSSIAEISRVLKPGGLFFCFFLPTRFSWTQQVSRWKGEHYHDRLYTPASVRQLLHGGGLELIDIWYRQFLRRIPSVIRNFGCSKDWTCSLRRKHRFDIWPQT